MFVCFKKSVPATALQTTDGSRVFFKSLDGFTGYLRTNSEPLIAECRLAQKQNRGGVSEISEEQYDKEFGKKKGKLIKSPPPYQEEIRAGRLQDTVMPSLLPAQQIAAAAPVQPIETPMEPAPVPRPVPAEDTPKFTPKVGRRKR